MQPPRVRVVVYVMNARGMVRIAATTVLVGATTGLVGVGSGLASASASEPPRVITETVQGQTPGLCEDKGNARVDELQRQGYYIDMWVGCYQEKYAMDWTGDIHYH